MAVFRGPPARSRSSLALIVFSGVALSNIAAFGPFSAHAVIVSPITSTAMAAVRIFIKHTERVRVIAGAHELRVENPVDVERNERLHERVATALKKTSQMLVARPKMPTA
ncbi:hypothetical protein GA0061083_1459 [Pseudarthrobacter enclensis]|nr:hypothetical protein GA0061083_1459 [Pseudarthrobacter enclensis]